MTPQLFFHDFLYVAHVPAQYWYIDALRILVRVLIGLFAVLLAVPPLVWWERRLLGWMQQRQGPNRVGPFGLLQTIADGIKLLFKEDMNPLKVDKLLFILAPIVFLIPSLVTPGVIPWGPNPIWGAAAPGVNVGILYILAWGSLAVYGIVMAGWSSNNKYSLLGGLRSSAQMISYELGMGLAIITVVLMSGSLSLQQIVENQGYFGPGGLAEWNLGKFFPMGLLAMLIYTITMFAETNRAPFDLPEAETELVAGYHTEYTSMKFATFFMGEYANMIVTSAINATLFWGGYKAPIKFLDGPYLASLAAAHGAPVIITWFCSALIPVFWLTIKVLAGLYFFIWVRATLPRFRYDQLMRFGWQGVLPIVLFNVLVTAIAMVIGWLPAAAIWLILFWVLVVVFATSKRSQRFTTNTRRNTTITRFSSAQPFRTVAEHVGRGAQTLPPDAAIEGFANVTTESEADAAYASLGDKKG
jgi:NADH-quinone oxidoreductase subunit H